MFEPFHEVVNNVATTIEEHAAHLSRPVIGVMPAYFPLELIWAAGGYPVQLWGNRLALEKSKAYLQSYCCSVAHSMLELELIEGAKMVKGYAFTSLCDTLVNLREIYRRLFDKPTVELSIPITQTVQARKSYLTSIVETVCKGLEKMTGQAITSLSLTEAARLYGRLRALQRELYKLRREKPGVIKNHDFYTLIKAGFFLPPDIYHAMLENVIAELEKSPATGGSGVSLFVSGMVFDPLELHLILDELDVHVVDDDFANGWRTVSKEDLKVNNLVEGIAHYLFNPAPCCCLYNPANDRHAYLSKQVKTSRAQGVLLWCIKFCEPDAFDRPQLANCFKAQGLPVSAIELELSMRNFGSLKTRINAFCEILEASAEGGL